MDEYYGMGGRGAENTMLARSSSKWAYYIAITFIVCFATTELGACLSAASVAFYDIRF